MWNFFLMVSNFKSVDLPNGQWLLNLNQLLDFYCKILAGNSALTYTNC